MRQQFEAEAGIVAEQLVGRFAGRSPENLKPRLAPQFHERLRIHARRPSIVARVRQRRDAADRGRLELAIWSRRIEATSPVIVRASLLLTRGVPRAERAVLAFDGYSRASASGPAAAAPANAKNVALSRR